MRKNFKTSVLVIIILLMAVFLAFPSGKQDTNKGITLKVWDEFTDPSMSAIYDELIQEFEADHEGVKIERTTMSLWDSKNVIKPAMAAGSGPDILYHNAGPAYLGILFEGGLLLDLTDAYKKYGWSKKFDAGAKFVSILTSYRGQLMGLPFGIETPILFYNKDKMKELGFAPPDTYEDFLDICKQAKAIGINPLILGNKDGWPGAQMLDWHWDMSAGVDVINDVWFGKDKYTNPSLVKGAADLLNLYEKGYFAGEPAGISYDDANMMFYTGEGLMYYTGSWLTMEVIKNAPFDVGMMAPPGAGNLIAPNRAWMVAANTEYPEECLQFLDYLISETATKRWIEEGGFWPPAYIGKDYNISPSLAVVKEIVSTPPFGYFTWDVYLPPSMAEYYLMSTQGLFAGIVTPEQMMAEFQKLWEEVLAEGIVHIE